MSTKFMSESEFPKPGKVWVPTARLPDRAEGECVTAS